MHLQCLQSQTDTSYLISYIIIQFVHVAFAANISEGVDPSVDDHMIMNAAVIDYIDVTCTSK